MSSPSILLTLAAAVGLALTVGCASDLEPYPRKRYSNDSAARIRQNTHASLCSLYAQCPGARVLAQHAKAMLVFPDVSKAGVIVGGYGGNGAMIQKGGRVSGFYQTVGASVGPQIGGVRYGYAIFFMTSESLLTFERTNGWEVAFSPAFVIGNCGELNSLSTTSIDKNFYVVFFNHDGLMGAMNLEAARITPIKPLP